MTAELTALALAGLLQALQYALFAIPANRELGVGYTSSARDRPPSRQLSVTTTRREQFVDITGEVASLVAESGLSEGAALVYSPHTTAGVLAGSGDARARQRRDRGVHTAPAGFAAAAGATAFRCAGYLDGAVGATARHGAGLGANTPGRAGAPGRSPLNPGGGRSARGGLALSSWA